MHAATASFLFMNLKALTDHRHTSTHHSMAGTRSSARQAAANDSSPPSSAKSAAGTKRKADASSPANGKAKRGRPAKAKQQKTLEETMPDTGAEAGGDEDKDDNEKEDGGVADVEMAEAGAAAEGQSSASRCRGCCTEKIAAAAESQNGETDKPANGHSNGEGKAEYQRPDGCWFWLDNATYDAKPGSNGQANGEKDNTVMPGDSFKGENKEGESKEDPEKALKDSRGGAGLNALDDVKADEGDAGKTAPKVCARAVVGPEDFSLAL